MAAGHGGQALITDAIRVAGVTDLGVHQLRDVDEPLRLFQRGDGTFAPLRVATAPPTNLQARPARLIGWVGEVARIRQLDCGRISVLLGVADPAPRS